jgi:translation elongation factor EF-Tu-like GTPase
MPHLVIQSADVRAPNVIDGNVTVDDYLGVRFLSAPSELMPDEPLDCEMELMYHPTVDYDAVQTGATFTLREGGKVIGFGVVTARSA